MSLFKDKIIGVLYGGLSAEREISLRSGQAILEALIQRDYNVVSIDVDRHIDRVLQEKGVEVAFIALHGRYGEDGCIQGLLEVRGIPYTGSSVLASALAMDKYLTKEVVRAQGLPTTDDYFFDSLREDVDSFLKDFRLPFPVIVKPSREGSTIGIFKVTERPQLREAILKAARFDTRVLVEQFVLGREFTVAVLDHEPLPVVEVVPKSGFYDFEAKYTLGATEYFCPADIPPQLAEQLQSYSQKICRHLGCEGVARADFIVGEDEVPYFLEVNTLPGMTNTSLVPKAAQAAGISFQELVEKILGTARLKIE